MSAVDPLLRMTGIDKRFGATRALRNVSLTVGRGEVLALIGENGAGKSTLMKVLSGAHRPDSGTMELAGSRYSPAGPHDARLAGVAMIYQELSLASHLSVEDNIMLGREVHSCGVLRRGVQRERVQDVLTMLGHRELEPRVLVERLSAGACQVVEIARALVHHAKVLVFDEPTSSLSHADVEHLFGIIAQLKRSGHGIIYISHFIEEVRRVADSYAVLRDGENVGCGALSDVSDSGIVSLMVGRAVSELFPQVPHQRGAVKLASRELTGRAQPQSVSLELHCGEILGIAGLVGSGRTETLRCLFGLDPLRYGKVLLDGKPFKPTPRTCIRLGMGFLSEDRKNEGLAQNLSIADNATLSDLSPYSTLGWLSLGHRRRHVRSWMETLSIKAAHSDQPVAMLSGGNQQKVAIARVLHQNADVLLLDEPTRGIDVGTKSEIYWLMGNLAAQGKAILFVSSYLPELLAVCDRIAVFARGKLRDVRPVSQWNEESIMACAVASET
jgi:ribose transport system ATP-binding protein